MKGLTVLKQRGTTAINAAHINLQSKSKFAFLHEKSILIFRLCLDFFCFQDKIIEIQGDLPVFLGKHSNSLGSHRLTQLCDLRRQRLGKIADPL